MASEQAASTDGSHSYGQQLLAGARSNNVELVRMLLQRPGIDVNVRGQGMGTGGLTPLQMASFFGHTAVVDLLLQNGADPNLQDKEGETPLHRAAMSDRREILQLLLKHNADVTIRNGMGMTAQALARNEDVRRLLRAADDAQRLDIETKFLTAARDGNTTLVAHLIDGTSPPNLNCRDRNGNTALHCAANRGHKAIVILLLQHGVDTAILNNQQKTAQLLAKDDQTRDLLLVSPVSARHRLESARIEGALSKSSFRGWKLRWFVLDNCTLSYYNSASEARSGKGRVLDSVHLGTAVVSPDASDPLVFRIKGNSWAYQLRTEKADDRLRWLTDMRDQQTYFSLAVPVTESSVQQSSSRASSQPLPFSGRLKSDLDDATLPRLGPLAESLEAAARDREALEKQLDGVETAVDAAAQQVAALSKSSPMQGAAAEVVKNADDIVRTLKQSRETSRALWRTLSHCLNIMSHHEHVWTKRFELEKERRRVLEESISKLAAEHDQLERSVISISSRRSSHLDLASMGENECFFDASDGDFDEHGLPVDSDDDDAFTDSAYESNAPPHARVATAAAAKLSSSAAASSASLSSTDSSSTLPAGTFGENALATSRTSVVNGKRVHRTTLAQYMVDRKNVSLWAFLKQCMGKDLSKITMPVLFNEPVSFLQRLCEDLEYASLLDTAAQHPDPLMRIQYVMAFAASGYAATANRLGKPFNPLLGETFELERDLENGSVMRALCEQVSHHPPISALVCESPHFVFHEYNDVRIKFWGKSIEIVPTGNEHVRLRIGDSGSEDEEFTWSKVTTCVHNIIVGKLWLDQYGKMEMVNHTNNVRCVLEFKPRSLWFSPNSGCELEGYVLDAAGNRTHLLAGWWNDSLYSISLKDYYASPAGAAAAAAAATGSKKKAVAPTIAAEALRVHPAAKRLWVRNPLPEISSKMYNMTTYAMALNEVDSELAKSVAPTDSRLRPDQRALENGLVDLASSEKNRLEEKQRLTRKVRARQNQEHVPMWFTEREDAYNGMNGWLYRGGYWEAREKGQFDACPDIYGDAPQSG
ncbi:hypothetical protein CAOG_01273 [Capsaspora owczarzaki ATCC 30864]|nr:hypothetical protein CAOG_01273 [Capsaspora owczarzaki ATCC 30864]|eukprot:XP_004349793.2 hypothetical protein CAOG_01273 [Capsaspora owczarzaki ATCC 30864]